MPSNTPEPELIETLEKVGLSPYQSKAYVTILEMGSGTATTIADRSDVPESRIYDVLRDLEDDGLIEVYKQDSVRARVTDKDGIIDTLNGLASQFSNVAETIDRVWNAPDVPETTVSVVNQFDTVLKRTREAIETAEFQVLVCLRPEDIAHLEDALETATDRGVEVNLVIAPTESSPPIPDEDRLSNLCSEARVRDLVSPFLAIIDRTEGFFTPNSDRPDEFSLLVRERSYVEAFYWYFTTILWDLWDPIVQRTDTGFPRTYNEIRYCIMDIEPLVNSGATVSLTIDGVDTETGERRCLNGTVSDIVISDEVEALRNQRIAAKYAGRASILLETTDETVSVGGWNAAIEDVEAREITIKGVR